LKGGTKLFVAMNRNKKKLIKRVDETFLAVFWGDMDRITDDVKGRTAVEKILGQKSEGEAASHGGPCAVGTLGSYPNKRILVSEQ
jgi:hypothetical protein